MLKILQKFNSSIALQNFYKAQLQQKYIQRKALIRNFDKKDLKKTQKFFKNVLNTGFNFSDLELYDYPFQQPSKEGTNLVRNSYIRVVLPLKTNKNLKDLLVKFDNQTIRTGKILEIMDFMSGRVCYEHLNILQEHNYVCATASVDNFEIFDPNFNIHQNVILEAYLTYIGTRTMEVQVNALDENQDLKLTGKFLFVAKSNPNITIKRTQSAVEIIKKQLNADQVPPVPKLNMEEDEEQEKVQLLYYLGMKNQEHRIQLKQQSTQKIPPKGDEIQEIHSLLMNGYNNTDKQIIKMKDTILQKTLLSHIADKNVQNTTFGGTLMREQYELAFLTAYLKTSSEKFPILFHISDTQFFKPVPFGSILNYWAQITYIKDSLIGVRVTTDILQKNSNNIRTNEFNVSFITHDNKQFLMPESYHEAMNYIETQRRLNKYLTNQLSQQQNYINYLIWVYSSQKKLLYKYLLLKFLNLSLTYSYIQFQLRLDLLKFLSLNLYNYFLSQISSLSKTSNSLLYQKLFCFNISKF